MFVQSELAITIVCSTNANFTLEEQSCCQWKAVISSLADRRAVEDCALPRWTKVMSALPPNFSASFELLYDLHFGLYCSREWIAAQCFFWTGTFLYLVFQKELRYLLYFFENIAILVHITSLTWTDRNGAKKSPLTWQRLREPLQNMGVKWQQGLAEVCVYEHVTNGRYQPLLAFF